MKRVLLDLLNKLRNGRKNVVSVQELIYRSIMAEQEEKNRLAAGDDGKNVFVISVTSLVGCSHKYHLSRKFPYIRSMKSFEPPVILGRMLHLGVGKFLKDILGDGVELEKYVEKKMELDGIPVKIVGRADAIIGDTVVEIKTGRSDRNLPLDNHVLQLRTYMCLLGKPRGILLYLNPERITEYVYTNPLGHQELRSLVNETIRDLSHPRFDWECRTCIFKTLCPYKVVR